MFKTWQRKLNMVIFIHSYLGISHYLWNLRGFGEINSAFQPFKLQELKCEANIFKDIFTVFKLESKESKPEL